MEITVTSLNSMNNKVGGSSVSLEIPLSFLQEQNGHMSLRYFPWLKKKKILHGNYHIPVSRAALGGCLSNSEWDLS